jgi:prolyl-tRNA synthetase
VIAEKLSDEKGLVWPENVAPFKVDLVQIGEKSREAGDALYAELSTKGIEVLYDDRDERPGAKFADAELMGMPWRVTVSDRLVEAGQVELTNRTSGETKLLTVQELLAILK